MVTLTAFILPRLALPSITTAVNPISAVLTPAGVILMIYLGYRHYPFPISMLGGVLTIGLAHLVLRLSRIADAVQRDGVKSVKLFAWLLVFYVGISSAFYGLGWLLAKILS